MNWGKDEVRGKWLERWGRFYANSRFRWFGWEDLAQAGWIRLRVKEVKPGYESVAAKRAVIDELRDLLGRPGTDKNKGNASEVGGDALLMEYNGVSREMPEARLETQDFFEGVSRKLRLTMSEKLILSLMCKENFTRTEIGRVVGISGTRISQILGGIKRRVGEMTNIC